MTFFQNWGSQDSFNFVKSSPTSTGEVGFGAVPAVTKITISNTNALRNSGDTCHD